MPRVRSLVARQSRYSGRRLRTATRLSTKASTMLLSIAVLALLASVQGRAVNISNIWVLPEEGFPVFYRYFRDRISWYEADAVCQFHHANLVTVDTTAQYDAVRAYLKELDISSAVWVGLIRSNPDGDFTWTDYRGLSGDGYWSSAPDSQSAPLCAAADPTADYRWEARSCGGPTVASFICELPVPQWALGNEGCMVRALPALTILYLPESAAVQLTADCGMAGVKKVQCTGNVKREDLLKELSCAVEEEMSSSSIFMSTTPNWPASTDLTFTDQDTTDDVTTEDVLTTELQVDVSQPHSITTTSKTNYVYQESEYKPPVKIYSFNKYNSITNGKNVILGEDLKNSHSNFIPKTVDEDNALTNDKLEKLEDERNMQHKMLHEEIARVGNVENIFTQPTDHFIPPLVMAKARMSDDMTVLSLAEKHAQQLAEKQFNKQNFNSPIDHSYSENSAGKSSSENMDKTHIISVKPTKIKDAKKEILKTNSPKKYINEKHYDVKSKIFKDMELKSTESYKTTESVVTTKDERKAINYVETTTLKSGDDFGMELSVMLKDAPLTSEETNYAGDMVRVPSLSSKDNVFQNDIKSGTHNLNVTNETKGFTGSETVALENVTMTHEVIKITLVTDDPSVNSTIFEISTKIPVFHDKEITQNNVSSSPLPTTHILKDIESSTSIYTLNAEITSPKTTLQEGIENATLLEVYSTTVITTTSAETTETPVTSSKEFINVTEIASTANTPVISLNQTVQNITEIKTVSSTTSLPVTAVALDKNTNHTVKNVSDESADRSEEYNVTYIHDLDKNMTDSEEIDDYQSPLLSGAVEPMHRPPRTRRPQQPNRNKFNPFRILG